MQNIPNTTQIPNPILDELMPRLKDVELRVLLVITRQTLGWVADERTGQRKEKDWISIGQLMAKTGRSANSISKAITTLCQLGVVEARDGHGALLDTPQKRSMLGGRIFYRLATNSLNQRALFVDKAVGKRWKNSGKTGNPHNFWGGQKMHTTKPTQETKEISSNSKKYIRKAKREENAKKVKEMTALLSQKYAA